MLATNTFAATLAMAPVRASLTDETATLASVDGEAAC
jgi:hypothetical protein